MNSITSQLTEDLTSGFSFGKEDNQKTFLSFTIKVVTLLIPGIVLGYYIDKFVKDLYDKKKLGNKIIYYIAIQTLISIAVIYILSKFKYTDEFQYKLAGMYFSGIFFGIQHNYLTFLQTFLNDPKI